MKKFLITILFASMFSPALVFGDNKSEKKNDNGNSGKSFQMVQHREKDEKEKKDKREKENKKGEQNNQPKKVNYFLCKTDLGWNVVPLEGIKNKNSNNALGTSCWKLPHGLAKKFKNLTSTTTPDTLAPVISSLTAGMLAPTSVMISWNTNELTTGSVYFSTTTPVNTNTATTLGTTTLSLAHALNLTALFPNTTYYFVVVSKDGANNTATSTEQSFITPTIPDTIAPIISGFSVSGIASTTANVSWNTNELTTGKVYFGTMTLPTLSFGTTTLSLAHAFGLTGLTASTTYYLMLESKDASNNTATSTISSFVTGI